MKLLTKLFIVIDIFVLICFFVVYGPFEEIKTFWITTSMETMNHKYLSHIFYSEEEITKTLKNNYFIEITEETDPVKVTIGVEQEKDHYESIYEEQILKRDKDDLYKLIEFKYNEFDCYLVAIYDPKRVHAVSVKKLNSGSILTDLAEENDAIVAINGGGYFWSNYMPRGLIVSDGVVKYASDSGSHVTGGFNEDGVFLVGSFTKEQIAEKNIKEALSFTPVLISNGNPIKIQGTGGSGLNPRTVLAQRKDGIVLFLVVNGYGSKLSWKGRGGVYLNDLLVILQRYGAYNAINMDGGSSTTMVIDGKLINDPCEPVKNGQDYIKTAWILK